MKKISVSCPGSCGELFQCVIDGRECLLSYNIDKRSFVTLYENPNAMGMMCLGEKMQQVLSLLPETKGLALEHYLEFPVCKGCSSSTADMLSGLKALSLYQCLELTPERLTQLCATVEPTDSVGFDKWTVIDPLTGEVLWQTDWQPKLYVYILEPTDTVKTVDLARMTACHQYPVEASSQLFHLFQQACQEKSLAKLGQLATKSALLNNQRLPKPYLTDIIALSEELQFLGVNIAHSGTVVGILLTEDQLAKVALLEDRLVQSPIGTCYQNRTLCQIIYEGVRKKRGDDLLTDD